METARPAEFAELDKFIKLEAESKTIGSGGFGDVYRGVCFDAGGRPALIEGKTYFVKVLKSTNYIDPRTFKEKRLMDLMLEVQYLLLGVEVSGLQQQHICICYAVDALFEGEGRVAIIMEPQGIPKEIACRISGAGSSDGVTNLRQLLSAVGRPLRGPELLRLLAELVAGVHHINKRYLYHRDLKDENVLVVLERGYQAQLLARLEAEPSTTVTAEELLSHVHYLVCDLSGIKEAASDESDEGTRTETGTRPWWPPEMCFRRSDGSYAFKKVDIWGVALVVASAMLGRNPFSGTVEVLVGSSGLRARARWYQLNTQLEAKQLLKLPPELQRSSDPDVAQAAAQLTDVVFGSSNSEALAAVATDEWQQPMISHLLVDLIAGMLKVEQQERFDWPDVLQHPAVELALAVMHHDMALAQPGAQQLVPQWQGAAAFLESPAMLRTCCDAALRCAVQQHCDVMLLRMSLELTAIAVKAAQRAAEDRCKQAVKGLSNLQQDSTALQACKHQEQQQQQQQSVSEHPTPPAAPPAAAVGGASSSWQAALSCNLSLLHSQTLPVAEAHLAAAAQALAQLQQGFQQFQQRCQQLQQLMATTVLRLTPQQLRLACTGGDAALQQQWAGWRQARAQLADANVQLQQHYSVAMQCYANARQMWAIAEGAAASAAKLTAAQQQQQEEGYKEDEKEISQQQDAPAAAATTATPSLGATAQHLTSGAVATPSPLAGAAQHQQQRRRGRRTQESHRHSTSSTTAGAAGAPHWSLSATVNTSQQQQQPVLVSDDDDDDGGEQPAKSVKRKRTELSNGQP